MGLDSEDIRYKVLHTRHYARTLGSRLRHHCPAARGSVLRRYRWRRRVLWHIITVFLLNVAHPYVVLPPSECRRRIAIRRLGRGLLLSFLLLHLRGRRRRRRRRVDRLRHRRRRQIALLLSGKRRRREKQRGLFVSLLLFPGRRRCGCGRRGVRQCSAPRKHALEAVVREERGALRWWWRG